MEPSHNGNQVNPPQSRTGSHQAMATASSNRQVTEARAKHESSTRAAETQEYGRPLALLLDLSGNTDAAMEWAAAVLPDADIRPINKADLKWTSKREALSRVRSLAPDIFCVFTSDLRMQSARGALMLFAIFAGARRVVIGDSIGRRVARSRLGVLMLEAPRFALELFGGYGLIVPLSWLLTEVLRDEWGYTGVLGLSLAFRGVVRASRTGRRALNPDQQSSFSALYVLATLTGAAEGGMPTHVAGFTSGAAALGHRLRFLVSGEQRNDDKTIVIPPSGLFSATKALFELWNNLTFTMRSLLLLARGAAPATQVDFIYQRYSRFNWSGVLLSAVTGLPLALEFNGSEIWVSRNWDPIGLLRLLKRFERLNQRAADLIFVVSDVERRNLIDAGVSPAKIIVNPNGVDPERFRPECGGREIRRSLRIDDRTVVGFVGTFGPWHGAPVLAQAATLMNDPGSRCHFVFIGGGEQRAQTESIIESAGERDVHWKHLAREGTCLSRCL